MLLLLKMASLTRLRDVEAVADEVPIGHLRAHVVVVSLCEFRSVLVPFHVNTIHVAALQQATRKRGGLSPPHISVDGDHYKANACQPNQIY